MLKWEPGVICYPQALRLGVAPNPNRDAIVFPQGLGVNLGPVFLLSLQVYSLAFSSLALPWGGWLTRYSSTGSLHIFSWIYFY